MKEIRRLTKNDMEAFRHVNNETDRYITNKDWFHIFSDSTVAHFFSDANTHVIFGCFIDEELAGVSLYDYDPEQCAWLSEACRMAEDKKGAELGGSMVLPKFRGNNVMYDINTALKAEAKKQGLAYFVATAHPDNIASNSSLKKLGFTFVTTGINPSNIIRNIYLLEL